MQKHRAMQLSTRLVLALMLATAQISGTIAEDVPPESVGQGLVPFSANEGLARLARSTANVDFPALANQFEAQSNPAFCGPTSAALNAVRGRSPDLPRDRSRLREEDLRYVPKNYDPQVKSRHLQVQKRDVRFTPNSGHWSASSAAILALQVWSLDAQDRPQPAIRLSRKDWLLRADRAVLWPVLGAGCASGSCPAGLFAEVGLRWWRRWSPHNRRRSR